MAIASFEPQEEGYVPSSWEKRPISRPLGHRLKIKDTLLSQTLKVEEKKVSLVFFICGPGAKILAFLQLDDITYLPVYQVAREYFGLF